MAVSANSFFVVIALILASILVFIRPHELQQTDRSNEDIAEMELRNFTLYELDTNGLKNIMLGTYGFQYKDRIEVEEIDYTDSTRNLRNNILADYGVYNNNDIITLEGNVRYYREDGMILTTDEAVINQEKETVLTPGPFKIEQDNDNVVGNKLYYDRKAGKTHAKRVVGYYTLKD